MTNVLITGARAPIAVDLARSFAAAGLVPHMADSVRPWGACLARVAQGRLHSFAPPRFRFEQFSADLARLIDRLDPVFVIPTCEEVFYLAEAAARLGLSDRVFAPPLDVLGILHSKVRFADLARNCGLAAPPTQRVCSVTDLNDWRARSEHFVFKPEFSRFASHTLVRPSRERLGRLVPTPEQPWAVQEYVDGEEFCLWSGALKGEIVAFAAYKPLWRFGRSASFYFETNRDPALLVVAQTIARATNATGHLSFDVIRCSDGTIVPIECNPRGISGLHLFDGDARLARAIMGQGSLEGPAAEARHLGPAMWLLGSPQAVVQGTVGAFRRDLLRSRDVLAPTGEPWLRVGALLDAARFAVVGLSRGRSASGQTTDDIEWNGTVIR